MRYNDFYEVNSICTLMVIDEDPGPSTSVAPCIHLAIDTDAFLLDEQDLNVCCHKVVMALESTLCPVAPGNAVCKATLRIGADDESQSLNNTHRYRDYPTNILSFPDGEWLDDQTFYLGDMLMAARVVAGEAAGQGKDLISHIQHLTLHGLLHLMGFDHEEDEEAVVMENLEIRILNKLNIKNPYI